MQKRLALLAAFSFAIISLATAQRTDTNPSHRDSSTILGGPRYRKSKTPTSRYLHGTVTDNTSQPISGALVTLINDRTKEKLTFITKKDGRYHFEDLSFTTDYGVQALYKNETSEQRKVSQYDSRADVVRMLELQSQENATEKQ